MWSTGIYFVFLWATCQLIDFEETTDPETPLAELETAFLETELTPNTRRPFRTRPSGIAQIRSALTLDWPAAEDFRQRNLADAYRSEPTAPVGLFNTNCVDYPKPSAGKVARLLLELLRNLEGDNATLIIDIVQNLVKANFLMENKYYEAEPDLDSLLKVPETMLGETHATFPRILAMLWLSVTDPHTVRTRGWCSVKATSKFIAKSRPKDIAKQMRVLDPVIARVRFIIEEFIHRVTPINMYATKATAAVVPRRQVLGDYNFVWNMDETVVNTIKTDELAISKIPLLDADGKVHEDVNVFKGMAPPGQLPNIRLTDGSVMSRGGHSVLVPAIVMLLVFS